MNKQYIGDSVYVDQFEMGGIILTTENGYEATNTIILEPEVITALTDYLREIASEISEV